MNFYPLAAESDGIPGVLHVAAPGAGRVDRSASCGVL